VLEITGLRTSENVLRLIDPQILKQALNNDAAAAAATGPPTSSAAGLLSARGTSRLSQSAGTTTRLLGIRG
jgi:hypothetical protein